MKIHQGRPTVAEVDRSALRGNLAELKRRVAAGATIMAIVKADGYGHGIAETARALEREGVTAFGVATVEEGVAIREAGVPHPEVYVFGSFFAGEVELIVRHRMTPVVIDLDGARLLNERLGGSTRPLAVHVKADTGLGRLGVPLHELGAFVAEVRKLERIRVTGLCSHLGSAVRVSTPEIERQAAAFRRAGELFSMHGCAVKVRHLANSAAVLERADLHFEMVRPGLALYGLHPSGASPGPVGLVPAMRLCTQVLQVRRVPAGQGVGYDRTFVTARESRIAALPVGYADGYPRSLSNRAQVLVRSRRAPVVGRVSMDVTMVDVTDVPGVERGDEVVLWGKQGAGEIRVDEVAAWAGTISYELLTTVGRRVPRVYVDSSTESGREPDRREVPGPASAGR